MFDAKLHSKNYSYVRNRFVIPMGIEVENVHAYLLHKLKQEYRDELLGMYIVWDTYNAEKKHESNTYKVATARLDFYIHVYVFTHKRATPFYMQVQYHHVLAHHVHPDKKVPYYWLKNDNQDVQVSRITTMVAEFLTDVRNNYVYAPDAQKEKLRGVELPLPLINYDNDTIAGLVHCITAGAITDGVRINPFYIVKTSETHTEKTLEQAMILAKMVGATMELNRWTTRVQRTRTKWFTQVKEDLYPRKFKEVCEANTGYINTIKIMSGAYTPIECIVLLEEAVENPEAFELIFFNPFASVRMSFKMKGIETKWLHRLATQTSEEALKSIGRTPLAELLPTLEKSKQ